MITPRRTTLVRVPDLHAFRRAIVDLVVRSDPAATAVIVPNAAAAGELAALLAAQPGDGRRLERPAAPERLGPALVTRAGLYERLSGALGDLRLLSTYEREAIARAALCEARASVGSAPDGPDGANARATPPPDEIDFDLDLDAGPGGFEPPEPARGRLPAERPAFVAAFLQFYDQLRRQGQQVARFEELLEEALARDAEFDRGAAAMLDQTRLLAAAFRAYERRVEASGAVDEHVLRERLLSSSASPLRAAIVTVGDWIAEPGGLHQCDFDLLARLPGLERLDIVATDRLLDSGFHERLDRWLPGIAEVRFEGGARPRPHLACPPAAPARGLAAAAAGAAQHVGPREPDRWWFTFRDREEELLAIARRLDPDAPGRTAIVYKRPLPYLYLAREILGAEGIPYRTADALPLAAEPAAAALDVMLEAVAANFTRTALVALLGSPHFVWEAGDGAQGCRPSPLSRASVSAFDRALAERRYLGDPAQLRALAGAWARGGGDLLALPAMRAALAAVDALAPLADAGPLSLQVGRVLSFLAAHRRRDGWPGGERSARAHTAITETLERLRAACAHDDPVVDLAGLVAVVRRWIEEQTFAPAPTAGPGRQEASDGAGGTGRSGVPGRSGEEGGVWLIDDQAARYGEFDDMTIVGLVEAEWPEKPQRNIFYSWSLLGALGWPSERDWRRAAEARFLDLLASANSRVALSTITLDDEALVEASPLVEEAPRAGLSLVFDDPEFSAASAPEAAGGGRGRARRLADERLSLDPPDCGSLDAEARAWMAIRLARPSFEDAAFHGGVGAQPPRAWSVSALETYLDCPFRFFARHVLELEEEPEDAEAMDPRREGEFVHRVFESFFAHWEARGGGAITPGRLEEARLVFAGVVEEAVSALAEPEAALARTRLLGSPAAAGLGEAVLRMEAERPVPVVERLLEHRLDGVLAVEAGGGVRLVPLKGKADRIDLLEDGTFRLIDYKLGSSPDRNRALQLPIYGLCAEQQLAGRHGRDWTMSEAAYIAFRDPRRVVPLFARPEDRKQVLRDAQQRLVETIDAIERGQFPARPRDVRRCETCPYAAVCRKDYGGDV